MRTSHTTKQGKAKCLEYRNGKRCGRVAKHVIEFKQGISGVRWGEKPVCDECRHEWVETRGAALEVSSSARGYIAHSHTVSGWTSRAYTPIGATR